MTVSDARRLQVYEQAREHWGEVSAEVLMELVVPAGQDMATKADVLRMLLIALTPLYLGMLGLSLGVAGLYFTG